MSVAASVGLVPAIGPWAYYGYGAFGSPAPSAEAAFLADLSASREGRFTALLAEQGLVTIPSFHVVFAVLFTWVLRQERLVYPVVIMLKLGVIAVTFPIGWHYLADHSAAQIWAAAAIGAVRRIHDAPARYAQVEQSTPSPLQGVIGEGGSS